jgi:hypothetical protein
VTGYAYIDKYGIYHVTDTPETAKKYGGMVKEVECEYALGLPIIDGWYCTKDTDGIWITDGKKGGSGKRMLANAPAATQRKIKAFFDGLGI